MFIESEHPFERGTLITIECDALDRTASVLGVGRVVWRRAEKSETGPMGMGITFVKLSPSSAHVIARQIAACIEAESSV